MDFGAHLPLMDFGGHPYTLDHLVGVHEDGCRARLCRALGQRPPGVHGSVAGRPDRARRGDGALGRHDAGDHRGSGRGARCGAARQDVGRHRPSLGRAAGRGRRARVLGARLRGRRHPVRRTLAPLRRGHRDPPRRSGNRDGEAFVGRFASTEGIRLEPRTAEADGPPIWVASWGSEAGLRRVARLGDGWLASAYNTTPEMFDEARRFLRAELVERRRDPDTFPNALATMWCYITEDRAEAERVLRERVVPTVHRPEEVLRERLPIGPAGALRRETGRVREGRCPARLHLARRRRATPARALLGHRASTGHGRAVTRHLTLNCFFEHVYGTTCLQRGSVAEHVGRAHRVRADGRLSGRSSGRRRP